VLSKETIKGRGLWCVLCIVHLLRGGDWKESEPLQEREGGSATDLAAMEEAAAAAAAAASAAAVAVAAAAAVVLEMHQQLQLEVRLGGFVIVAWSGLWMWLGQVGKHREGCHVHHWPQ
jgi:hypothetical protein